MYSLVGFGVLIRFLPGQVLHRVFPFYRGLFEDKVGNVWCALDMLLKLRANLQLQQLTRLCLLSTLTFRQLAASCLYSVPVLRIRDILVRIRIRGPVPLTNGSGSCYFCH